jgi:lipopolysaccharide export system ATP-binding protein
VTTTNPQRVRGKQVLRTEKLVKIYGGRAVVNGVDINCHSGEIVGLLGPNGAGKTTSFYMVVGLVRPNSGKVFFEEKEVTDFPMFKRARMGMGYLPQEESIFRKMTVEQNIMAILETQPLNKKERKHRCEELLTQFGIEHVGKQLALTLSGGEKRRLTIARSLVTKPSLLMLDEPFSGVDPIAVYDVQQIIKNLGDMGLGILITDHNVRETLNIVDRAYLISEGKVVTQGDKDFLLTDPIARKVYLGESFQM